ncbi:PPE family protein [Mycobacterium haemophilum DSM 44634]|nr:hypothetical protein B586_00400 [Mycobacterium haemophilum DSM 44634]
MLDFGALPPEINSGRIYSGPGSGPLVAAATAWQKLATELNSTAASYDSVISGLISQQWRGPSSLSMAAAAAPYVAWMRTTAAQAEQAAAQALAAASAYEAAYSTTVPPAAIAANRSMVTSLIQTNILGQNTPAIATVEAQYGEMWAQDIAAMDSYAGSSAAASELTPFTSPPQTSDPAALASQAVTPAAAAAAAAAPTLDVTDLPLLADLDLLVLAAVAVSLGSMGIAAAQFTESTRHDEVDEQQKAQALEQNPPAAGGESPVAKAPSLPLNSPSVAAVTGRAATVGGLSVPQTWAVPPAVRRIAAMLPSTTPPIIVQDDSDNPYTGIALASLVGSGMAGLAVRGGAPSTPAATTPAGGHSAGAAAAAARPAAPNTPAAPAAAAGLAIPGLPEGLPPGVVANLAATLAAIPGATIIVVPPSQNQ